MNYNGIEYTLPTVTLLNESGIGVPEVAARTCYDSYENSENECIQNFETLNKMGGTSTELINNIEESELLNTLAWVHHHHSIIEHTTISYHIKGTSRGVLQEHARHRLQAISVRSTRYTMSDVINAYISSLQIEDEDARLKFFFYAADIPNIMVTTGHYNIFEAETIIKKLDFQRKQLGDEEFLNLCLSKENKENLVAYAGIEPTQMFNILQQGKKKRNVGDSFKHIVTDNWKVDMVVTFNLRSLKNYFDLRDSGAAWFQIRWLAQQMKEVTPLKYMKLIDKKFRNII